MENWFDAYPEKCPHEINPEAYNSIVDTLNESFTKFADREAFVNFGKVLTYREVDILSRNFAAYLQKVVGLKKGDRVAIQVPNTLQTPIAQFGALRAGLTVVNTNPLYTAREMEHQFKDSGAKALVILANYAHLAEKVVPKTDIETVIITELGDLLGFPKKHLVNSVVRYVKKMVPAYHMPQAVSFNDALAAGSKQRLEATELTPDDIAFLQYTGGTTGVSKGVMLTHRNIVANMEQISAWINSTHDMANRREIIITALPLYHIFSLTVNLFAFFKFGAFNILITNPRDLKSFVKEIKPWPFTMMTGVNTLFRALANFEDFKQLDFSSFNLTVAGGMAVQQSVSELWEKVTGLPIVEGYGATETSPVATCNPTNGKEQVGTIGLPLPSTKVAIFNDQGEEVPTGEEGEICVKGPQVMKGYWNRPDATAEVFNKDGWLKTGDVAVAKPDGFFKIVDRIKDMILVSGFNVYPNEIEDVVCLHSGVLEAAAIGIKDDCSGEAVKLFVVKKDPALSKEDLLEHCKANLTGYKRPKVIEFRDELPKTNVGKILRRGLRDEGSSASQ